MQVAACACDRRERRGQLGRRVAEIEVRERPGPGPPARVREHVQRGRLVGAVGRDADHERVESGWRRGRHGHDVLVGVRPGRVAALARSRARGRAVGGEQDVLRVRAGQRAQVLERGGHRVARRRAVALRFRGRIGGVVEGAHHGGGVHRRHRNDDVVGHAARDTGAARALREHLQPPGDERVGVHDDLLERREDRVPLQSSRRREVVSSIIDFERSSSSRISAGLRLTSKFCRPQVRPPPPPVPVEIEAAEARRAACPRPDAAGAANGARRARGAVAAAAAVARTGRAGARGTGRQAGRGEQ